MNEIIQETCNHEQKTGPWTDLLGKPTHPGKTGKEVAVNWSEKKSKGIREKSGESCPKSQGKNFLKNQEMIHNSKYHQQINKINPEK